MTDSGTTDQPDFFESGKTYSTDLDPYKAPEQNTVFVCSVIAVHPVTGDRFAFGFARPGGQSADLKDDWNLVVWGRQTWDGRWVLGDRWAADA